MTLRNACFTAWDLEAFTVPDEHPDFRYCVYQVEICPHTERIHVQGYIEMKKSIRWNTLKKILGDPSLHLEPRGSRDPEIARHYCMCPGPTCPKTICEEYKQSKIIYAEPIEFGTWTGKQGDQGQRRDIDRFAAAIREGKQDWELSEQFPGTFLRYSKSIPAVRNAVKPVIREPPQVHVIYGETGRGKTHGVYSKHPVEEIFSMDAEFKWFDGYTGQKIVLFDEYRSHFKVSMLLRLLDKYPLRVPIKGGFVNWIPEIIYITSQHPPDMWYPNITAATKRALERRITTVTNISPDVAIVRDFNVVSE